MKFHLIVWIKEQIEWVKSFFLKKEEEDAKPIPSITSLIKFMIMVIFLRAYFVTTWRTGKVEDVPENWLYIIIIIIAVKQVETFIKWKLGGKSDPKQ
jgi:hypothetical protein